MDRPLEAIERKPEALGKLFQTHPTIIYLRNTLKEEAKALTRLAEEYKNDVRSNESIEICLREHTAGKGVNDIHIPAGICAQLGREILSQSNELKQAFPQAESGHGEPSFGHRGFGRKA